MQEYEIKDKNIWEIIKTLRLPSFVRLSEEEQKLTLTNKYYQKIFNEYIDLIVGMALIYDQLKDGNTATEQVTTGTAKFIYKETADNIQMPIQTPLGACTTGPERTLCKMAAQMTTNRFSIQKVGEDGNVLVAAIPIESGLGQFILASNNRANLMLALEILGKSIMEPGYSVNVSTEKEELTSEIYLYTGSIAGATEQEKLVEHVKEKGSKYFFDQFCDACALGDAEAVRNLAPFVDNINAQDSRGRTPATSAVCRIGIVQDVLKRKEKVSPIEYITCSDSQLIMKNKADTLGILLERGATMDVPNKNGKTPNFLIERDKNIDDYPYNTLKAVVSKQHHGILK